MPSFDYLCNTCNHTQEVLVRKYDDPVACPKCSTEMTKQLCSPTFVLKGAGFSSNGTFSRAKDGPKLDQDLLKLSDVELNRECGLPDNCGL